MFKKIKNYIKKNELISENDAIIIGVSGGSDSMLLLNFLVYYNKEINFNLKVVHINHGMRGKESDEDQQFVEKFCFEKNIPISVYKCDLSQLKIKYKTSEENAGRIFRYECFNNEFIINKNNKIAVAHNKNDCIETFFINLFRGSGINGLTGIKEKNNCIIRPLLFLSKNEIEEYCHMQNISFRIDYTNLENKYTRNKIRNIFLPNIKKEYNPNIENTIFRTINSLAEDENFISEYSNKKYNEICIETSDKVKIFKESFINENIAIKKRILLIAIGKIKGSIIDIENKHIVNALELIENNNTGKEINLPSNIVISISYDHIFLYEDKKSSNNSYSYKLSLDNHTYIGETNQYVTISKELIKEFLNKNNCYTKFFCYDIINGSLIVRSRLPGDKIYISKINGHKKIKSIFIDDKIHKAVRSTIPLIIFDNQIIWIVNEKNYFDSRYSPKNDSEKVYIQIWED